MTNQQIIEKIHRLQQKVAEKNAAVASALEQATIPLIEYESELATAKKADLLRIKGVGDRSAELILRIIAGEHFYQIAQSIPATKQRPPKWVSQANREWERDQ